MVTYLMNNNIVSSGCLEKVDIRILTVAILWPAHVGYCMTVVLLITEVVTTVHDSVGSVVPFDLLTSMNGDCNSKNMPTENAGIRTEIVWLFSIFFMYGL